MAIARKNLVDRENAGFYHCTNRCVRRAFLYGTDKYSGKNYDHRKSWLERRIVELCQIFAVEIFAYAIMDNHYHLVLHLDPKTPVLWSKEEVAERWLRAYPGSLDLPKNASRRAIKKREIMSNDKKVALYRQRLGNLSWFMGRLNEPLAKSSNAEDCCTGKFWEGRFSSQVLLDEAAVLSCMAYVDLNPVRARITNKLETSNHTSIKKRIDKMQKTNQLSKLDACLEAVIGKISTNKLSISTKEYIQLVDWTGRSIIDPTKGSLPPNIPLIFERFNLQQSNWPNQIENYGSNYCHFVGTIENIRKKAVQLKLRCLHGTSAASLLYI